MFSKENNLILTSVVTGILFILLTMTPNAFAVPIPGLFNTGVDNSGNVLPFGTPDPHYSMTGPVSGAQVMSVLPFFVNAPAGSEWIGPSSGPALDPPGLYTYSLSFDLSGFDPSTAVVQGQFSSDNSGQIFLNGAFTGFQNANLQVLTAFNITSGFNAGTNTLEFRVTNFSPTASLNPTGLLVGNLLGDIEPTSTAPIPEPSTMLLFGTGLVGLVGWQYRKKYIK